MIVKRGERAIGCPREFLKTDLFIPRPVAYTGVCYDTRVHVTEAKGMQPLEKLFRLEMEFHRRLRTEMLGYAETAEDLQKGDDMHGVLPTGDLGYCDSEGIYFLTGRVKRISKVYGYRINLDEVEEELRPLARVVATSDDRTIFLYFEGGSEELFQRCVHLLSEKYKLHYTTFICRSVASFPLTPSGKVDYQNLR